MFHPQASFFDQLSDRVAVAVRLTRRELNARRIAKLYEELNMATPIDRLKDKFAKARGVAQRVASNMEAEADALIAQEDAMKAKTESAFAPHRAILAEAHGELKAIEEALGLMTNGGPPLSDVGNTAPASVFKIDPAP